MLTKLVVTNFKRFKNVEIELGNPVVFVGPNNSGKTSALQALALWDIGLRRWNEKRGGKAAPEKRPGVTINRRDLIALPVPDANLLWRDLHVRDVQTVPNEKTGKPKPQTKNIRVNILVEGVTDSRTWKCGLEFDYANEESFYCRPLRLSEESSGRMSVPDEACHVRVAFLPPMSGLASNETRLDSGAINVRLGEGRTAEVLRNLCHQIVTADTASSSWQRVREQIKSLFGVELEKPVYIAERGEITMSYREPTGVRLDLSSSGRGLQQTLLLLAHLLVNPGSVLLLDEPDAHLEILRQRQIYELLTQTAKDHGSQVIVASHSEVILNEAADRDVVVAFVGTPHRIDDRGNQLLKSLKVIGFEQYYQAEQTGWVLYLEGSTDYAILRAFAQKLNHPVQRVLERPFVHYIENLPHRARDHFRGLREAKTDLVGFILCDRIQFPLQLTPELQEYAWRRREIENYLCQPETLLAYADASGREMAAGPVFAASESRNRTSAMEASIRDYLPPAALRDRSDRWWIDTKASDEFLDRVFEGFLMRLGLPRSLLTKSDYHILAGHVPTELIDPEITEVLDGIFQQSQRARPLEHSP